MFRKLLFSVATLIATAPFANAGMLVNDTFDYPEGNLYGCGNWLKYGSKESEPIQVINKSLSFNGYQDAAGGKAVSLTKQSGESLQILFKDKGDSPIVGEVYYSALIHVNELPSGSKTAAFFCLTGANASDPEKFGDAISGSEGGGLFAQASGDGFQLGVSRNVANMGNSKTAVCWGETEYTLNTTYLVVMKYESVEGADNDRVSLWVNPQSGESEPAATVVAEEDATESLFDIRGIELRQGSSPVAKIPGVTIDDVRVATSWTEIFSQEVIPEPDQPEIQLSEVGLNFGSVYQGLSYSKTINVKAQHLKGNITVVTETDGEVTASVAEIPQEEAESADGYNLTLTLNVSALNRNREKIQIESPDAQSRTLTVDWSPIETVAVSSIAELYNEDVIDMNTTYLYTGEATVTCIDAPFFTFYAQDATAAMEVRSANGCGYDEIDLSNLSQGDNVTSLVGHIIFSSDGGIDFIPVAPSAWTVTSEGNTVAPKTVTFEEIANAEGVDLMFQLVTVENITFDPKYGADPDYYGWFNVPFHYVYDLTGKGMLWYFQGTDIYKSPTTGYFDKTWKVTGICYYLQPEPAVAPRALSDFSEQENASVGQLSTDVSEISAIYDIYGRRVTLQPADGIYIVRFADGSVRKMLLTGRK